MDPGLLPTPGELCPATFHSTQGNTALGRVWDSLSFVLKSCSTQDATLAMTHAAVSNKRKTTLLCFATFPTASLFSGKLGAHTKPGKAELGHKTFLLQPKGHTVIAIKYIFQKIVGSFSGAAQLLLLCS